MLSDRKIRNLEGLGIKNLGVSPKKIPEKELSLDYSQLSYINQCHLVDSFFSLHYPNGQLIYVSEVVEECMNPMFAGLSIPNHRASNLSRLVVKVFIKRGSKWRPHIYMEIDLHNLVDVEEFSDDDFTDNAVILKLGHRWYGLSQFLLTEPSLMELLPDHYKLKTVNSYSFDSIRTLGKLDRSIQESEASKQSISKEISNHIDNLNCPSNDTIVNAINQYNIRLVSLDKYITKQKSQNDDLMSKIMNYKTLCNKVTQINDLLHPQFINSTKNNIDYVKSQIDALNESRPEVKHQFCHLAKALLEIFPILPVSDNSINLKILGLEFPSSVRDVLDILYYNKYKLNNDHFLQDREIYPEEIPHELKIVQINTGISFIIQLLIPLMQITKLPVYYMINFQGNSSTIVDFDNVTYPLFYDAKTTKKINTNLINEQFEKGISLLNKNLLLLIHNVNDLFNKKYKLINNIPIECLDNFLWNLNYLLLFFSAEEVDNGQAGNN